MSAVESWEGLDNKSATRCWVANEFEYFHSNKGIKNVLLLPGRNILCLSEIIDHCNERGIDISKVIFHLVESKRKEFKEIEDAVRKKYPIYFNNCKFYHSDLSRFIIDEKIDFCWMDFLGNLNYELLEWFNNWYSKNISELNVTFFTFQQAGRGSNLLKDWISFYSCDKTDKHLISHREKLSKEKSEADHRPIFCLLESLFLRNNIDSIRIDDPAPYKDKKTGRKGAVVMRFFGYKLKRDNSLNYDNYMDGFFKNIITSTPVRSVSKPTPSVVTSPVTTTPSVVSVPKNLGAIKAHCTILSKKATLTNDQKIRLEEYKKVLGIV
jgi:hypothetical protein